MANGQSTPQQFRDLPPLQYADIDSDHEVGVVGPVPDGYEYRFALEQLVSAINSVSAEISIAVQGNTVIIYNGSDPATRTEAGRFNVGAGAADVTALQQEIDALTPRVAANEAAIALRATVTALNDLAARVTALEQGGMTPTHVRYGLWTTANVAPTAAQFSTAGTYQAQSQTDEIIMPPAPGAGTNSRAWLWFAVPGMLSGIMQAGGQFAANSEEMGSVEIDGEAHTIYRLGGDNGYHLQFLFTVASTWELER